MISYPETHEYAEWHITYISQVPADADIVALLREQATTLRALIGATSDADASIRPAPQEWSIKEVLGHVADTERVFAYRATCIARAERAQLPSFNQDDYVAATDFNLRSLADLLDEFDFQRRANVLCLGALPEAELGRSIASGSNNVTARAYLFIMAGHVQHHIVSLTTDYGLKLDYGLTTDYGLHEYGN